MDTHHNEILFKTNYLLMNIYYVFKDELRIFLANFNYLDSLRKLKNRCILNVQFYIIFNGV